MTGGKMLRTGRLGLRPYSTVLSLGPHRRLERFRAAAALTILLALGACSQSPPPVSSAPRSPAVCEALRPDMPISYSSSKDTPETVKGVRQANARFAAACP